MICWYRQDIGTSIVDTGTECIWVGDEFYLTYNDYREYKEPAPSNIWDLIKLKTVSIFCSVNYIPPYTLTSTPSTQYIKLTIRKLMFHKSGYLPKRIRRIKKSK